MFRFLIPLLMLILLSTTSQAQIVMRSPGLPEGEVTIKGYVGWTELSSLSLSVDNQFEDSGEKGGTEYINIGLGEIGDLHATRPTGIGSPDLFRHAITGNSLGEVEIHYLAGTLETIMPIAAWKLDRAFVTSYSQHSDNSGIFEEFAFFSTRIAFAVVDDQGVVDAYGWNQATETPWTDHELEQDLVKPVTGVAGDFTGDGNVDGDDFLYWQRNEGRIPLDGEDLQDWQVNYGDAQSASAHQIPEPAAGLLVIMAGVAALASRRR